MINIILNSIILSFIPVSELRGSIPYAYLNGISLPVAFVIGVIANALVPVIAMIFLSTFHKWFYKIPLYQRKFDRFVAKSRKKIEPKVNKYGYLGLMLFVAIPLPITGAWTGTLGAWILGLDKKKSCIYVALGVLIAGIIVSTVLYTGVGIGSIFIKKVNI